jgi:enterochelin esterase-like enzyme
VSLYIPSRMRRDRRMPLLVVHDGGDFLNFSSMGTVLDNLMHRRLMADCVVAFTYPGDRLREYAASAAHSRFLTTELVPQIEGRLQLRGDPRSRVLMGASFGGVAALSAAVRTPGFYGGLLLESPSLRFTEAGAPATFGDVFEPVVRFVNSVRAKPKKVTDRLFLTYGAFEPLAVPDRAMTEVLGRMTDEMRVVEALDGHNWINWRDRLLDGLGWLFPGEARLIYPG